MNSVFAYANDGRLDSNLATVTITIRNIALNLQPITEEAGRQEGSEWFRAQSGATSDTPPVVVLNGDAVARGNDEAGRGLCNGSAQPRTAIVDRIRADTRGVPQYRQGWKLSGPWSWGLLEDGGRVSVIAFSPYIPNLVYLVIDTGNGNRLLRSIDAGLSWDLVSVNDKGSVVGFATGPFGADGSVRLIVRFQGDPGLYQAIDHPYL